MLPPDQAEGGMRMTPPGKEGSAGFSGRQSMTLPDVSSGATESSASTSSDSASSDEVQALKEKNQEIKAQIEDSSQ